MINSHCGFVPSTTNSLYTDGHHVVQINDCDNSVAVVDNLVTISPTESSSSHEHSGGGKLIILTYLNTPFSHELI